MILSLPINAMKKDGIYTQRWILQLCLMVSFLTLFGLQQICAQSGTACNDQVNITLDTDCSAFVGLDHVLEGQQYPDNQYVIVIECPDGTTLSAPGTGSGVAVGAAQAGQICTARILHTPTGVSCWGDVRIEEKNLPVFQNCEPFIVVDCDDDLIVDAEPIATESCTGEVSLIFDDVVRDRRCGSGTPVFRGFEGDFGPVQWTTTNNPLATNGTVDASGAPATISLTSPDNGSAGMVSYCYNTTGATFIAGNFVFNWYFNSTDVSALNDHFGYTIDGVFTQLSSGTSVVQSGFEVVRVEEGETFCFVQQSSNGNAAEAVTTIEDFNFRPELYGQEIDRTWFATDGNGNVSTCTQTILVRQGSLLDVQCPPSFDGIDQDALNCFNTADAAILADGFISPEETGFPTGTNCPNMQVLYNDIWLPTCGVGGKLLRRWTILDWCTGEEMLCDQVVKVIDDSPPIATCTIDLGTVIFIDDHFNCTASFSVPAPEIIFECSSYDYTITYKTGVDLADCEDPILNDPGFTSVGVSGNSTSGFQIDGLELGCNWINYVVTDACGFETTFTCDIIVQENVPPTPVCESNTVVALDQGGWAEVDAIVFDDHSYDACGSIDRFEVKRLNSTCPGASSDLQFGPSVRFCCEDIANNPIKVSMRVYDLDGNFNECIVDVTVQDKFEPTITQCPANITVNCGTDFTDLSLTGGMPEMFNICGADIDFEDTVNLDACGTGFVSRRWRVFNESGQENFCTQTIFVEKRNPFDRGDITFPRDTEVTGCEDGAADPSVTGEPRLRNNEDCANVTAGFSDEILSASLGTGCTVILRTWTVLDWCQYTGDGDEGRFVDVQEITLGNGSAPVFTSSCDDVVFNASGANCDGEISLIAQAEDDCTPASQIQYRFEIDLDHSGTFSADGGADGYDASSTFSIGTHAVRFYATDICGNTSTCEYEFEVRDSKAPTPTCFASLSFPLSPDGTIEIWASDFIKEGSDDCSDPDDLRFSFSADVTDINRTFTCNDIENGAIAMLDIQVYITDEDGNNDFCNASVTLTDNQDLCPDADGAAAMVSGIVISEEEEAVEEVEVVLQNMFNGLAIDNMTNNTGRFQFGNLKIFKDYKVVPVGDTDPLNGVSTLDIVLIQRYILGMLEWDSPYRLIAADINKSQSVSAADLIELRRLILGMQTGFNNNANWRFVPRDLEFPAIAFPFFFDEFITFENLVDNQMNADFIVVKTGDVNGNAVYNFDQDPEVRTNSSLALLTENQNFLDGETIRIELSADDIYRLAGMQFTLNFDSDKLKFKNILSGAFKLDASNIGTMNADEGLLTFSWNEINAIPVSDDNELFTLVFEAKSSGVLSESLGLDSRLTRAEAYNKNLEILDVELEYHNGLTSTTEMVLHQNKPNPFSGSTEIALDLSKDRKGKFQVYNIDGKVVYTKNIDFNKGRNVITMKSEDLPKTGVYYYQIDIDGMSKTKKMIVFY